MNKWVSALACGWGVFLALFPSPEPNSLTVDALSWGYAVVMGIISVNVAINEAADRLIRAFQPEEESESE